MKKKTSYNQLDKIIDKEQKALYRNLSREYNKTTKKIRSKIKSILKVAKYDTDGNITNEKAISKELTALTPLIVALWTFNKAKIEVAAGTISSTNLVFYEFLTVKQLGDLSVVQSLPEINKTIKSLLTERNNIIKWDKIMSGNANRLDKRLQKLIMKDIKQGKTIFQIERDLQKTMNLNKGKAQTIARTETNYYNSRSRYEAGKRQELAGYKMYKVWEYTWLSREPRNTHMSADGQVVEGMDGLFNVGGVTTVAPQQFGIAEEDINCNCDYQVRHEAGSEEIKVREFYKYMEEK